MAYFDIDTTIDYLVEVFSNDGMGYCDQLYIYDATVTVIDGGSFHMQGYDPSYSTPDTYYYAYQSIYVSTDATLKSEYTEEANLIYSDCPYVAMSIDGTVDLKNAKIYLGGDDSHYHDSYSSPYFTSRIYVSGSFSMNGGSLTVEPYFYYSEYDEVRCAEDAVMTFTNVDVDAAISSAGVLCANRSTFSRKLTIQLDSGDSLSEKLLGSGNTFTQQELFYLDGYGGDFSDVWGFIGETEAENSFIAFSVGTGKTVQIGKPKAGLEHVGYCYVGGDKSAQVIINEGTPLLIGAQNINDGTTLSAHFEKNADAIRAVADSNISWVKYGGTISLQNANIDLSEAGTGSISMYSDSGFQVESGTLDFSETKLTLRGTSFLNMKNGRLLTNAEVEATSGTKISLDSVDVDGLIKISAGAHAEIVDSVISELQISLLAGDVTISGNDFSNATIKLLDANAGGKINLSGNNWGTTDREVIIARLGDYADNIYLGELEGEYTGTETFLVTNTNDAGEGSLRCALELAAAYSGTRRTEIVFDSALAGSSIHLASDLTISSTTGIVNLKDNPVSIIGGALIVESDIKLNNMALEALVLAQGVSVEGSNNVLTGGGEVLRVESPNVYLGMLELSVEQPDTAYINIDCSINNGVLGLDMLGIPYVVTQDTEILGSTQVDKGEKLVLESGVKVDWVAGDLTIAGELIIENENLTDSVTCADNHDIKVLDGGKVEWENANVDLHGGVLRLNGVGCIVNQTGGTMKGNVVLHNKSGVYTATNAVITGYVKSDTSNAADSVINLTGCHVKGDVEAYYADANIQDSQVDGEVWASRGDVVVKNSTLRGKISCDWSQSSIALENCLIDGWFDTTYLNKISGTGNVLKGDKIAESHYSELSNLTSLLSFVSEIEAENPYVELSEPLRIDSDVTMVSLSSIGAAKLEYRVDGWKDDLDSYGYVYFYDYPMSYIESGNTLTLGEGVRLNIGGGGGEVNIMVDASVDASFMDAMLKTMVGEDGYVYADSPYYTYFNFFCSNLLNGLVINGNLEADYETVQNAITAKESHVRIAVGCVNEGSLQLKNAGINLAGESSDVIVGTGSTASMTGGTFAATEGWVNYGTTILDAVEVRNNVRSSGDLTLTHTLHSADVLLEDGSTATIENTMGIGSLVLKDEVQVSSITENDFSHTTIDLSSYSGSAIDLSGNYWGADVTTLEDITARILGYSASKVIISDWLASAPERTDVVNVTNTNDSGEGSLRWAVEKAASFDGEVLPKVVFDEAISDEVIELKSDLVIPEGVNVVFHRGVAIDLSEVEKLTVKGSITAENGENVKIFTVNDSSAQGLVLIEGAANLKNIVFGERVSVGVAGSMALDGCGIAGSLFCADGAQVELNNMEINFPISNAGQASQFEMNDCDLYASLGEFTSLEGLNGSGNSVRETEILSLGTETEAFTGTTDVLNELFAEEASPTAAYVTILRLGDCTLNALQLPISYRANSGAVVDGKVSLDAGVCVSLIEGDLLVESGGISASWEGAGESTNDALRFEGDSQVITLSGESELVLKNAGLCALNSLALNVESGSVLLNHSLLSIDGLAAVVSADSSISIIGSEFAGTGLARKISILGQAELEDSNLLGVQIEVGASENFKMAGCSGLVSLSFADTPVMTVIRDNDFSTTSIDVSALGNAQIDLSGNYWGTTDKQEIIDKIIGYSEEKVILDSWLGGAAGEEFKLEGVVGKTLLSADSTTLTLNFSHAVEMESISTDSLYMLSVSGERVDFTGFRLDGTLLIAEFAPLANDGQYNIVVCNTIRSEAGQKISMQGENTLLPVTADVTPESVESIRLHDASVIQYLDVLLNGEISPDTVDLDEISLTTPSGSTLSVKSWNMPTRRILRLYVDGITEIGEYQLALPSSLADAAGNVVTDAGAEIAFVVQSADVAVVVSDAVYSATTDGSCEVSVTVQNNGNLGMEKGVLELWLTKDGKLTERSLLLYTQTIDELAANAVENLQVLLNLGKVSDLQEGEYTIVAKVSADEKYSSLVQDNVATVGSLALTYPTAADLSLKISTDAETIQPGQTLTVRLTLSNEGNENAGNVGTVILGIIPEGGNADDMLQIHSMDISTLNLVAGFSMGVDVQMTIPSDISVSGNVQLVAKLDTDVYELPGTTENNTALSEVISLAKSLGITASVESVAEGSSTKVVYVITRTGDCSEALTINLDSDQMERLGLPQTVTIAAGQRQTRVQAAVVDDADFAGDTPTTITASAGGYISSSVDLTILEDEQPTISVALEPTEVTEGKDSTLRGTVSINTVYATDVEVKLGSNFSGQIKAPATVTIKAGETAASFEAEVLNDETAEIDKEVTITAAATGFNSGAASVVVRDDDIPQVELILHTDIVSESDGYYAVNATLVRSGGSTEAITVRLQDVDGLGLILPPSIPMGAGETRVKFIIGVVDDSLANGERTGKIRGTITIDDCGCDASTSSGGGIFESTLTVQDNDSPTLSVSLSKTVLREGGQEMATLTITSNYVSDTDVVVSLEDAGLLNLPASLIIPAGSSSITCEISAKADGVTDGTQYTTITAKAEGFISGRGYMQVTDMDMPDLVIDSVSLDEHAIAGQKTTVTVTLRNQGYASSGSSVPVVLSLSDGTILGLIHTESALQAGDVVTLTAEITLPEVSGQFFVSAEVDQSDSIDELIETNNIKSSGIVSIGSGYSVSAEWVQDVLYSAGALDITGVLSAEADGLPIEGQLVNLYIYRNGILLKTLTTESAADGSFATDFQIPAGLGGVYSVKAGVYSDMSDTLDSAKVAALSTTTDSKSLQWLLDVGDSQTGTVTITNSGAVDLHGVNLQVAGLPDNISFLIDEKAVDLAVGESAVFHYTVSGESLNVGSQFSGVFLSASSDEGTCLNINGYSYVKNADADLRLSMQESAYTVNQDSVRYLEMTVTNYGGGDSGKVHITLPTGAEWLSLYSGATIENLASGESATVVLKVDATASEVALNAPQTCPIVINADNADGKKLSFDVTFVDTEMASLQVNVYDSFSLQGSGVAGMSGARASLFNAYTRELVDVVYADENGNVNFGELNGGKYYMYIDADGCYRYKANISLEPGEAKTLDAWMTNSTVEYTFTVKEKDIEEKYTLEQEVTYNTNVPDAVIVFDQEYIALPDLEFGNTYYVSFSVSNYGLTSALDFLVDLPELEHVTFTLLNPIDELPALTSQEFWLEVVVDDAPQEKGAYSIGNFVCVDALVDVRRRVCNRKTGEWEYVSTGIKTTKEYCFIKDTDSSSPGSISPDRVVHTNTPDIPNWEHIISREPAGCVCGPYISFVSEAEACVKSCLVQVQEFIDDNLTFSGILYNKALDLVKDVAFKNPLVLGTWLAGKAIWNMGADMLGKNVDWIEVSLDMGSDLPVIGTVFEWAGKIYELWQIAEQCNVELEAPALAARIENLKKQSLQMASSLMNIINSIVFSVTGIGSILRLSERMFEKFFGRDFSFAPEALSLELIKKVFQEAINFGTAFGNFTTNISAIIDQLEENTKGAVIDVEAVVEEVQVQRISEEQRLALHSMEFATTFEEGELDAIIDRWNRTIDYLDRGITSADQLEAGENTDFFTHDYMESLMKSAIADNELMLSGDKDAFFAEVEESYQSMVDEINVLNAGVCASVQLKFTQTAAMTREAFEGLFTLTNGGLQGDLTNLSFRVFVTDMNGVDVTEHFAISYYGIEGFESVVAGEGGITGAVLKANGAGEITIQYIPDRYLAAEASQQYYFGAELSYVEADTGKLREIGMAPVTMTINPSPSLELHYFLTESVYSDDPHTLAEVEAAQKGEVGLLVKNNGNGVAKNFTLSDLEAEFEANEKGLALELSMLGSSLNGGDLQQTGMSLNFGNLEGGSSSTAVWYFTTNLHGRFTDYTATYTRIDSLGDEAFVISGTDTDVSLIESITPHFLVRSFQADGDTKTDFLVNDEADAAGAADGIFFGDGSYAAVNAVLAVSSTSGELGGGSNTITLTMFVEEGWNYFRINDPGQGNYRIESISVGEMNIAADMIWQTDRVFAFDGSPTYVDRLHWVAEFAQAGYVDFTVTYSSVDVDAPTVESISGVEDKAILREAVDSLLVTFNEEVNTETFNLSNISLKLQNEAVHLDGLTWEWSDDNKSLRITNLSKYTQNDGLYVLQVLNHNVEDSYGNAGDGAGRQLMWTKATSKVALKMVDGYTDRKLNKRVDTLLVTFTASIAEFGTDAISITHTAADGTKTEVDDLSGLTIRVVDDARTQFAIEGLDSIQNSGDGNYSITISSEKVKDTSGNFGTGFLPADWSLHEALPVVKSHTFLESEIVLQAIDTIELHFSHAIGKMDLSKVSLYCNGEAYVCDSLDYTIDSNDTSKVIISGMSQASPVGKAALVNDGKWQVSVDLSGVEDAYGNVGSGVYHTDWLVDTTAPDAIVRLTLNGKDTLAVADRKITVGAELPETGLLVSVYDKGATEQGLGTLLWSGPVEESVLEEQVDLLNVGARVLTIVTTDTAGNTTTNTYDVLVDTVVLTATMNLEDSYKTLPDSVLITFSAPASDLPLSALSLSVDGETLSLEGASLTKRSDSQWELSGLAALSDAIGTYVLSVDMSAISKLSSGLQGQGIYSQSFAYDPISEVRVANCEIASESQSLTRLSISFTADINYEALLGSGLLRDAVRLVNQADGSITELEASGFNYAERTLTWSGDLALDGGRYAVVLDPTLLTATNGSPLVGNSGASVNSLTSYRGDMTMLGVAGESYSAPYATDWNNDGYVDLIIGEKVGNEGKVRLYLNDGKNRFVDYSYVQSNGGDLSVSASGCQGIVVAMQDLTGDGIADLVAGLSDGSVYYYTGRSDGTLGAATELMDASIAGSRAYPTFHDWNGDGVSDLVVGTGSGHVKVVMGVRNASTGALTFSTPVSIAEIEVPGRAAPAFADVNGDGVSDMIVGAGDGSLTLYYGTDNGFCKVSSWKLEDVSWERTRVSLADLNGDSTLDLIVGGSTGAVYAVYGSKLDGSWSKAFEVKAGELSIKTTSVEHTGKTAILSWTVRNETPEAIYVVEIANNAGFADASVYEVTERTLTLNNLAEGTTYWRVSVKGASNPAVEGTMFTVDTVAPLAPIGLEAILQDGKVTFRWAAVTDTGSVKYELRVSHSEDFSSASVISVDEPTASMTGLAVGDWFWQVRAVDASGNVGAWTTAEKSFSIEDVVTPDTPDNVYHAQGLVVSEDGELMSGYWDADKTGQGDSLLCWAASASNMLAWWQNRYELQNFTSQDAPATADSIFHTFTSNWNNASGREKYGLIWWVSGETEDAAYQDFYSKNYTGGTDVGEYYAAHYDEISTSQLVKEVSLTGVSAEQIAMDWASVYESGGIMSVGVYRTMGSASLSGGHTLTLWSFSTDASGRLCSMTVTDSDDKTDALLTLNLVYNVTQGYYQINQAGSSLHGYLLGDYSSLGAFQATDSDNNEVSNASGIVLESTGGDGSYADAVVNDWLGKGDTQDYFCISATKNGSYSFSLNAGSIDTALWLSIGTMNAAGDFVVDQDLLINPDSAVQALSGVNLKAGEQYYISVKAHDNMETTEYSLSVSAEWVDESLVSNNNSLSKATALSATGGESAIESWVGAGDALDYYRFEMAADGHLHINLAGLEKNTKVRLLQERANGDITQKLSTTAKVDSGLDRTLSLTSGVYYLEIASYDMGSGLYNSTYALELEQEENGTTKRYTIANA
ncbi:MAG: VCBS repeat-containing protein [Akkermansia sp.]|nr:VCBS repeat-containing protein [Akkermansia sp.]